MTILSSIVGSANPIYIFYRDGIFYTLNGVLIPFVEKNSDLDLMINLIYQSISAAIAFFALITIQCGNSICNNTIEVTTDLTIFEMEKLSNGLVRGHFSDKDIFKRLKLIFCQVHQIDTYA